MADVVWSDRASRDIMDSLRWLRRHRGERFALAVATEIRAAVSRAAASPLGYVWVGSVYDSLAGLPIEVRRVLTQDQRYVVFYRWDEGGTRVNVLAVRGAGQQPPAGKELIGSV